MFSDDFLVKKYTISLYGPLDLFNIRLRENSYETGAGHDAAGCRRVPRVFLGVLANTSGLKKTG